MDSSTAIAEQLEDRKEEVSEGKPQPQRDDVITPTTGTAEKLRTPTDVLVGGLAQPERGQDGMGVVLQDLSAPLILVP